MRLSKTQSENAKARSHAANLARRERRQPTIDWDVAIANLKALLDRPSGTLTPPKG